MTDREKAIVMAHTGICMLAGDKFQIFHQYVEDILGRPVQTIEMGMESIADEIKEKSREDFIALCMEEQEPCEDAISRQAVLAIAGDSCLDLDSYEDTREFCDEIKELLPVTPQPKMERWIPVSERLPDTLKDVIIAFSNEPNEYDIAYLRTTSNKTYIANGSKKEWVSSMGETTYAEYEVDAWMPIIPYQSEIPTGAEGNDKE